MISVGDTIFHEGSKEASTLMIYEKRTTSSYTFESNSKQEVHTITLNGTFLTQGGYHLSPLPDHQKNSLEITISDDAKQIEVTFPAPEILSVDMVDFKLDPEFAGLWNQARKNQKARAIIAMKAAAKKEINEQEILKMTAQRFSDQVLTAIHKFAPSDSTITSSSP